MNKSTILANLQDFNKQDKTEGFVLCSLFGSYARGTEDMFSDVDLTYKIDHNLFFKDDAFAKLSKIEEICYKLENLLHKNLLHKKVDLIPANTKNHLIQEQLKKEQISI